MPSTYHRRLRRYSAITGDSAGDVAIGSSHSIISNIVNIIIGSHMRRTTTASRWATPHRRYTGGWRQNPWINAAVPGSSASVRDDGTEERQLKAAMRAWENEGGSLGAHRSISL